MRKKKYLLQRGKVRLKSGKERERVRALIQVVETVRGKVNERD